MIFNWLTGSPADFKSAFILVFVTLAMQSCTSQIDFLNQTVRLHLFLLNFTYYIQFGEAVWYREQILESGRPGFKSNLLVKNILVALFCNGKELETEQIVVHACHRVLLCHKK